MHRWKNAAAVAVLLVAYGWPAVAEANGEHVHVGGIHFDPLVGGAVAVFVGLVTLMFVGQWIRFNAARRNAAGTTQDRQLAKNEEGTNGNGQENDGRQQEP